MNMNLTELSINEMTEIEAGSGCFYAGVFAVLAVASVVTANPIAAGLSGFGLGYYGAMCLDT
jgi:hypothetical protein